MIDLLTVRGLLFIDALALVLLFASFVGSIWHSDRAHASTRVALVGIWVVLIYVTAGQVKAYQLGVPVDEYTWVGLIGVSVANVGLIWLVGRLHLHGRG